MKKRIKTLTKRQVAKNLKIVESIDLSIAKKKDIERYIRALTPVLNKAYPTMNIASAKDFKQAVRRISRRYGLNQKAEHLGLYISGRRKGELLEQARILERLYKGDMTSDVGKQLKELQFERAYQTFIKSEHGKIYLNEDETEYRIMTKEEYRDIVEAGNVINDIVAEYGSEQVYSFIRNYGSNLGAKNVGNIIKKAYTKVSKKGKSRDEWQEELTDRITDMIKEALGEE